MAKSITKSKKNAKNKRSKDNKKNSFFSTRDPLRVRIVFGLFIFFMIMTFAIGAFCIFMMTDANNHNGLMTFGDKYYVMVNDYNTGSEKPTGAIINSAVRPSKDSTLGFIKMVDGKALVFEGKVLAPLAGGGFKVFINAANPEVEIDASSILGTKESDITNPIYINFMTSKFVFLIIFAAFVAATFVIGLIYFLVSPRGAKQLENKKEDVVVKTVTTVSSDNSELLRQYLSSDDNIQPLEPEQNEVGELLNINYYNSVRLHNGEVYAVVKKYEENARRLQEFGASDMDIIKMNMIGNTEFDDLILNTHKEKTMNLWELIDFANTLPNVYCVKKRGTLNWTYKYKSKTLFIIKKESDDSDSYKVAIKVYPDAANKLNIIYKALEDSSFPNGPYWYMFNDLRNVPANVIKWMMTESLNISKWQQVKADLLRESPTLESYKLDVDYMHDMVLANTKMFDMGKFVIITQSNVEDEVRHTTVLETGFDDINMNEFTKEISMAVPNLKNVQMSILTRKNASEALVGALCDELLDFRPKSEREMPEQTIDLNSIAKASTTKVVKKDKKRR